MIVFVFFSIFLSSINIVLSLTMNYVSKKGREYKEQLRRYSSFEEELSLMTVVLQLYKERIKNIKNSWKIFSCPLYLPTFFRWKDYLFCFFLNQWCVITHNKYLYINDLQNSYTKDRKYIKTIKKYIKIHRVILTLLKVCFIYAPLKATKQTVSFDF